MYIYVCIMAILQVKGTIYVALENRCGRVENILVAKSGLWIKNADKKISVKRNYGWEVLKGLLG